MIRCARIPGCLLAMVALLGAMLLAAPRPAPAETAPPIVTGARFNGDQTRVRFVADLTYAVSYNVYVLPEPFRVIVDLPEVGFQVPPDQGAGRAGFIDGFRYGLVDAGKSRIVLDATGPVLIEKSFVLHARADQPARIVVDLIATDPETFARVHRADQVRAEAAVEELPPISANGATKDAARTGDKRATDEKTAELGARNALPLPRPKPQLDGAKKPARRAGERFVVVIDAGHGGIDSGTVSASGVAEKDIVLEFARELARQLEAAGRYRVIMTRDGDRFLTLRDRVRIARRNEADLFIALHADAIRVRGVRGATVYTLSERASDSEADALAQKENRSDIIAGVDLAAENDEITGILIDLAQRETKNHSVFFAKSLVDSMRDATRLHRQPLRSAGFRVLTAPDVPSVLLELGYLSNRGDEALLTSPEWRRRVAGAVTAAIGRYFSAMLIAGQ
jgi:N-acetylmuramoyl-L-alanine amidase